jgi:hypothetical protein
MAHLDRLIGSLAECFTPEVARRVVDLRFDQDLQSRFDELADKCNEGAPSAEEREEYVTGIYAGEFIALLQRKAAAMVRG